MTTTTESPPRGARCEPVSFANFEGRRLFGIVHRPDGDVVRGAPVILLSPGVKYRVGPHRLYVKLARRLARMGFLVLRFDFSALGDSEGLVHESQTPDFYRTVQLGRYVGDTRAAMDWMEKRFGHSRFIVAGLCGGALTGLLAGSADRRADSLIALGLPVLLDGSGVDPARRLTRGELSQWREGYLAKVSDPRSWLRLITLRSNYRVILQAFGRTRAPGESRRAARAPGNEAEADNLNPLVAPAFERFASARKLLMIFAEADRLYPIYQERFALPRGDIVERCRQNIEVRVAASANHVFSLAEWQREMLDVVADWLERHYPAVESKQATC